MKFVLVLKKIKLMWLTLVGGQSLTRAYRTHTYSTLEWEIIPIIQLLHYIHY